MPKSKGKVASKAKGKSPLSPTVETPAVAEALSNIAHGNRYTYEQVEAALGASQGLVSVAATRLGCDRSTIYDWLERYPELKKFEERKRAGFFEIAEVQFEKLLLAGHPASVHLALKFFGKDKGYTERMEMTGPNGGPMEVVSMSVLLGLTESDDPFA